VTPTQGGYFARTKCFHQRFIGCSDLGIIQDRSLFGSRIEPAQSDDIESLLTSSVLAVIRSHSDDRLSGYDTCITEVDARMSFQWRVKDQPKERILAVVDGHLNLKSYLPFFNSAAALGVKFLLLDSETHWITHASHKGLYHHYIPIDMTPDETFHERIASAVKSYGPVDGICAIATYCLLPVAKAAAILGLPTAPAKSVASAINKYETRMLAGGAEPTAQVSSVTELDQILESKTFVPKYPLIVKPLSGTGSAHVFRADNSDELLKAVQWTCEGSKKKALIEAYVDGPELDVNFVLLDGELLFFEIADDYPSPGDDGTIDSDFWENTNVLPSTIPTQEYDIVRKSLHELLLKMGLKTGVFHLEARVQDSTMVYTEDSGIVDLRQKTTIPDPKTEPKCVLIEVNPRPPGMPCILSSAASYGVNMYDLHLLASLADHERYRSFSQPFDSHTGIPNHARAWSQLVWLRADKSGICASDDVCGEFLERLSPKDRTLITASMCFFERGQKIPPLKAGVVLFGAFFVVTSRTNRHDVLRVANIIQRDFKIPVEEDSESARLSKRGSEWSKVGFLHGAVDTFDPVHNPNGAVRLDNAENVTPNLN
jgi:biotin carboxylase